MSVVFDTSLLDVVRQRQRATLEQERQSMLARLFQLLDENAVTLGIRRAYIFGSITRRGYFRATSDVDLAVEMVAPRALWQTIAIFSEGLGRPVDVIELANVPFATKIQREGIKWMPSK